MEREGPADESPPAFIDQNGPPCVSAVNSCVVSPVPPRPMCDRREMKGWSPEELLHFEEWVGPKVALLLPLRPGTFDLH